MRKAGGVLGLILAALLGYARWIEPSWLEVTRHQVSVEIGQRLKILQLSDLHTHAFGSREAKVLEIVRRESPDAILISGDTISNEGDWNSVGILLGQLRAPLGVFLVRGNWEHWRPDPDELKTYRKSGVKFLNNEAQPLTEKLWVVGLDDSLAGNPDPQRALAKVPSDVFKIALFHSPEYFDSIGSRVDLGLAGHTHGGQLRIPFLPPFWLPEGSGRYVEGWYAQGASRMYVSRGVGNSIFEMRFNCRPEVAVFQFEPRHGS